MDGAGAALAQAAALFAAMSVERGTRRVREARAQLH
jgi:hypothetical protein